MNTLLTKISTQTNLAPPLQIISHLLIKSKPPKNTHKHYQSIKHHTRTLTPPQRIITFTPQSHSAHTHTSFTISLTPQKHTHLQYQQKTINRNQNYVKITVYITYTLLIYSQPFQSIQTSNHKSPTHCLQNTLNIHYSQKATTVIHTQPTHNNIATDLSAWKTTTKLSHTHYIYTRYLRTPQPLKITLNVLLQWHIAHDFHRNRNWILKKHHSTLFLHQTPQTPTNLPVILHPTHTTNSHFFAHIQTQIYVHQSPTFYKTKKYHTNPYILTYKINSHIIQTATSHHLPLGTLHTLSTSAPSQVLQLSNTLTSPPQTNKHVTNPFTFSNTANRHSIPI